jgi:hypothetical protein
MVLFDSDGNEVPPSPQQQYEEAKKLEEQATVLLGQILADMAEEIANGEDPQ